MKAPIYNISATQGLGIKSLFNKIELLLNNSTKIKLDNNNYIKNNFFAANKQINTKKIKIAVIGKPNVGKSSFLNKLSNKNRHLISNKPGTTRDMIDSLITYKNKNYLFIDTAGIKKKRNINNLIDKQSITTTLKSLDRCMLALLLIDIKKGITDQDLKIASFVQKKAKGMIIIVNKCDLISLNKTSQNIYSKQIKAIMPFFYFAPICFISSLTGKNIFETIKDINIVFNNYFKKISTSKLNNFLKIITKIHKPPIINGTQLKLSYIVQSSIAPPIFIITCNQPKKIHFSYSRYILNKLHKHFSFTGVPLKIIYKNKKIVKLNCYEYNKIKL
jgi:GTP-binding protein